jgi:hypothetical protein
MTARIEVPEELSELTTRQLADLAVDLDNERLRVLMEVHDRQSRGDDSDEKRKRYERMPWLFGAVARQVEQRTKRRTSLPPSVIVAALVLAAMWSYARIAPEFRAMTADVKKQATQQQAQPRLPAPPLPANGTPATDQQDPK